MEKEILVAGATGDLGGRIIKALVKNGARVRALVREGSDPAALDILSSSGVQLIKADLTDRNALIAACTGISCVVSALAGLREVIVDAQELLLKAAIAAGVPRFIPSDYSTDYTQLPDGANRNFDLRREFKKPSMKRLSKLHLSSMALSRNY